MEVSGMNKYLFSHLSKQGMELIIVDVPQPKILRFIALFYTFCLPVKLWKKRFDGYFAKIQLQYSNERERAPKRMSMADIFKVL